MISRREALARASGQEEGWAVVTALALLLVMMALGLAALASVDTQQQQAGAQRVKESTFNLAEVALEAQSARLSTRWPHTVAAGLPTDCSASIPGATPADVRCPDPTQLAPSFGGDDLPAGSTFSTQVRDNVVSGTAPDPYYDPATIPARPTWDANADGRMWLRANATVRGRTRSIVALVQVGREVVPFPRQLVIAGHISTGFSSNKDAYSPEDGGETLPMSVRCPHAASGSTPGCVDVKRPGQIDPDTLQAAQFPSETAIPVSGQLALKQQAQATGTFFASGSCPPTDNNPARWGKVVYVENMTGCDIPNNDKWNDHGTPGVFVVERGPLVFTGNFKYEGLIYHLNLDHLTTNLVEWRGNTTLHGAVMVDFGGGVDVNDAAAQVKYNKNIPWPDVAATIDTSIVRSSWREIAPG